MGETVARSRLSPNALTALGLGTAAAAATLAAHGRFWEAGLVMLTAAAFDVLDGAVALATNKASQFGAIFDAIADRLSEFAMLLALLVWFSAPERADREAIILIAVTIAGSMLVPYTRSKAGEFGVHIRHGLGTRFERVVILAIGPLRRSGGCRLVDPRPPHQSHRLATPGRDLVGPPHRSA